jgi:hypothetical protein
MFHFTIRDLLWLTVVVALAVGWLVERSSHVSATTAGRALTLEQAHSFHLQIQEALPAEMTLKVRGFPQKKRTRGVETWDRHPEALGSWLVLDYSDKLRPSPSLDISLLLDPKGADAKWGPLGVRIEIHNEPNPTAAAARFALLNELRK